jgi:hypothetical protein
MRRVVTAEIDVDKMTVSLSGEGTFQKPKPNEAADTFSVGSGDKLVWELRGVDKQALKLGGRVPAVVFRPAPGRPLLEGNPKYDETSQSLSAVVSDDAVVGRQYVYDVFLMDGQKLQKLACFWRSGPTSEHRFPAMAGGGKMHPPPPAAGGGPNP